MIFDKKYKLFKVQHPPKSSREQDRNKKDKTRQQQTPFYISFIFFLKSLHQPKERTVQMKEYLSDDKDNSEASCT